MARTPRFNRGFSRKSRRSTRQFARRVLSSERLEDRQLLAAQAAFAPGEIIVGFEGDLVAEFRTEGPGRALQSAAARFGGLGIEHGEALMHRPTGAHGGERLPTLWKLPPGKDVFEAAKELSQLSGVAYAEPNYLVSTTATQEIPNDPSFSTLWAMHNTGQSGGTIDADIDAPEAWAIHKGTGEVVVAVIDTGVNYNHADLKSNMWSNPFEVAGNGIDDDGNGYTDDVRGYDFINNDADPMDDNGHGTHIAGTIGATGNNGRGVVGVNWNVKIMPLKFLGANNGGYTSDAIRAVQYANDMRQRGVNVVLTSNSWGGGAYTQALYDAIAVAGQEDVLFVAAAGNNGNTSPFYPAYYDLDNVISVAATDRNDQLAWFSNRGAWVDIAAPGVDIYSTHKNSYTYMQGTSMATPHVSGVAALVADYLRTQTSALPNYQDVRDAILNSGDQIPAAQTTTATGKRLNAYNALLHADVLAGNTTGLALADATVVEGDAGITTVTLTVTRNGWLDTTTTVNWTTVSGTAVAPGDYDAANGQLTFAPFEITKQFDVAVLNDTTIEPNESFQVVLSNATNTPGAIGVTMLKSTAIATILTDDVGVSINDVTVNEGNTQIGFKGEFISSGAGGLATPYSMVYGPDGNLYVSDISGNRILRYNALTGAPLPAPGQSGADFVPPASGGLASPRQITFGPDANGDGNSDLYVVSESTHSVLRYDGLTGESAGALIASGSGGLSYPRGVWFHSDGYVYVTSVGLEDPAVGKDSILRYSAVTGAPAGPSGLPGDAVFVPSGSGGLDNPSQVVFHEGHLYVSSTSQTPDAVLRFNGVTGAPFPAPGRTDALFVAPGSELDGPVDMVFRPDGLYVTSWRNDSVIRYNATTGNLESVVVQPGVGGIDSPIALLFEPSEAFLVRGSNSRILRYGPGSVAAFTVSLSSAAGVPVTVNYASADGTAIGDSGSTFGDFEPVAGVITLAPGETTKTIHVVTRNDSDQEANETFTLELSNPTSATITDGQGVGTILDNDFPDRVASSETAVYGTVAGSYASTHSADGNVESITEVSFGTKRNRLEHIWQFDAVTSGDAVDLIVKATHDSTQETFAFAWSTNAVNWTTLGTIGASGETSFALPGTASGTVYIRVSDTHRGGGDNRQDKLSIDQLVIRTTAAGAAATALSSTALPVIDSSAAGPKRTPDLDPAVVAQLLSDEGAWTRKSRVKLLV